MKVTLLINLEVVGVVKLKELLQAGESPVYLFTMLETPPVLENVWCLIHFKKKRYFQGIFL